jgi:NodT family efflux transporter outer membrane factor (OMF) lipoprotein
VDATPESPQVIRRQRRSSAAWAARLLAGTLAMGACAVGPNFTRPDVPVAQSWRTGGNPQLATQSAADSAWWRGFADPALDRLVELAYRQNLPLQIAGLRIVEARARLGIATGRQFPQLQVAVGRAEAIGVSENVATLAGGDRQYVDYQLGFDAAWEVDLWGKYRRGVEAEGASLLATVADYHDVLVSLTAEVARTYVTIRTFEVLIAQAQDNARIQEESLAIAQSRFRNGATSELDPTQAATLLESTRTTIPQLQAGLQQARNALGTLLGQPAGTIEGLLAGARSIPRTPPQVAVGMPAEMLRRRPDIRAAELNAAAQCARIGVAKADLFPSFTLFGTIGLQASTGTAATTHNLFSTSSLFYTAGPRISWPFFNYGRIQNGIRVEDARFQQLLVQYRNTVLRAAQEVEDALAGFLNYQQAQGYASNAVTAAQKSVEIAMVQYREGATDYQRVLDAQRSLLQQQNSLAQTTSSVVTNVIALYKALGGGWERRQQQPVVPEETQKGMKDRTRWGDLLSQPRGPERQENRSAGSH